ncbi:L-aminopeptidase DmpA. Serine peptidase. MEROPS family S58 [Algoriphagus faecimaris]|uniref:L-aminopeptidase DmpA. Serine peptidase. MEROPS family S58 n=1 Tax=Algoriphagus faecimaris TaxID=686796 RepID=A0A1G6WKA5_9BACT|nr:P1 family peptidase [Algoriphagus faecimaris]SDD66390.1 L-aminopeptidase DmpA. Serine peptidase. MEROPS family S58 [Algoriphagus faecimaris]
MNKKNWITLFLLLWSAPSWLFAQNRARELGVPFGVLPTGKLNAITDVSGVKVGHLTKIEGEQVRTGVTAILPHGGNLFQEKVPAAIFVGNGFGKLAGVTQVQELGTIESPIILTNTLSVAAGIEGVLRYSLSQEGNQSVQSVNAVVGETNDGYLNDIRGMHLSSEEVMKAILSSQEGIVQEGNVGAGTGTVCFGWKGGIGTASRKLPESMGGYTVGVLVQTNFGGNLQIAGVPVGQKLGKYPFKDALEKSDGSCMIIVATDAPVLDRNLERIAQRAMMGLAKTGGIASNGSGDYVIAFSTAEGLRIAHNLPSGTLQRSSTLRNDDMTGLFLATIEATEEAIVNSLFAAETMTGKEGRKIEALPKQQVLEWIKPAYDLQK